MVLSTTGVTTSRPQMKPGFTEADGRDCDIFAGHLKSPTAQGATQNLHEDHGGSRLEVFRSAEKKCRQIFY